MLKKRDNKTHSQRLQIIETPEESITIHFQL